MFKMRCGHRHGSSWSAGTVMVCDGCGNEVWAEAHHEMGTGRVRSRTYKQVRARLVRDKQLHRGRYLKCPKCGGHRWLYVRTEGFAVPTDDRKDSR
jgi:DNA-directed RNA polymerase subunit RPC12/RpoP